jgi:hypothetical protein
MKKFTLTLLILSAFARLAYSGTEYSGKEVEKQTPAPCPEWYSDTEWNVNLWGTYATTGTEDNPNLDLVDLVVSTTEGHTEFGDFDRYLGGDHAWGGGADIKYFFMRYFGVGVEGFLLDAKRHTFNIDLRPDDGVFVFEKGSDRRVVGSVLGTFTLRYPVPCTRFAPYIWAGVGAIFGGGERDTLTTTEELGGEEPGEGELPDVEAATQHFGSKTEIMGQFGGGLEIRFTRHIGWTNDFSWNVVNGKQNNFGMIRTGLNFAF